MFGSIKIKGKKVISVSDVNYTIYNQDHYYIFFHNLTFVKAKAKDIIKGFNHINKLLED